MHKILYFNTTHCWWFALSFTDQIILAERQETKRLLRFACFNSLFVDGISKVIENKSNIKPAYIEVTKYKYFLFTLLALIKLNSNKFRVGEFVWHFETFELTLKNSIENLCET